MQGQVLAEGQVEEQAEGVVEVQAQMWILLQAEKTKTRIQIVTVEGTRRWT